MVKYSARAARALGFLKRRSNDIEVYVEDTSSANMWLQIIQKAFGSNVKLTSVNMLGSKKNVIDACSIDQANDGRRKIYLVDGDLDHLCGKKVRQLKYFHALRAYCIENLLLSKKRQYWRLAE